MAASKPRPASTQIVNRSKASGIEWRISFWRRLIFPLIHNSGKNNPKATARNKIKAIRPKGHFCGITEKTIKRSAPNPKPAINRRDRNMVGSKPGGLPANSSFLTVDCKAFCGVNLIANSPNCRASG